MPTELHTHTVEKLTAVVKQIDNLLLSDFPYESSEAALKLFKAFFKDQISRVDRAASEANQSLLLQACTTANSRISVYLPLLGFLLRSTNVRNNFECYDSLLQLAQRLIGQKARIIISSEWDMSPLTYALSVPVLPDYVLLGMPAPESSNSLLLPLTGHELGHSVWTNDDQENKWASRVQRDVCEYLIREKQKFAAAFPVHSGLKIDHNELSSNMFLTLIVYDISRIALSQMEETYCDAIGLRIFGESFAHAFHYLLAPGFGGDRALHYPTLRSRAQFMVNYGGLDFDRVGYSDFPSEFHDAMPRLSTDQSFISQAADEITKSSASDLYSEAAIKVLGAVGDLLPESDAEQVILGLFKRGIPARQPRSLAHILNAAWQFVRARDNANETGERPVFEWTSELVLKSIEVLEFRRRLDA